jgi:pilus assembly protein FimV
MKTRRIPLAIAVAAALLTPSTAAFAAALGEVAALSALGERFRAEIRLVGDGTVQPGCFRVVAPANAAAGLPALTSGRVSIVGTGANARLVVRDDRTVHDPVVQLALENVCETRLRREYSLLMPFTAASPVSAPSSAAPARKPAATRTAPAAPRSAAPRPAKPRPQKAAARTWSTAAGESLESLGEALYPDDLAARERFSQATAAANPRLFPNADTYSQPLPAGTRVVIPNLRQAASAAPDKTATPQAASPAAPVAALAAQDSADRVVVDKSVAPTADAALAPRAPGESRNAAAGDDRATGLLSRERELAAAIDRSIIAEMELLARIKELEELQAGLEARLRSTLAAAPQAAALQAGTIAPAAAAPVLATAPEASAPSAAPENDLYLFAGLGIAALLLTTVLLRRRRGEQPIAATRAPGSAPQTEQPIPRASERVATPDTVTNARFTDEVIDTGTDRRAIASASNLQVPGNATGVEEHKSAVELADIMISFGRVQGAAETLAEFIRGNPREAVTPWLKLLEVYRAAGQRAEFDTIAGELNKTFNVTAVNWDNYQTLRAVRTSLEDLPHITETLQKNWRTTACQRYLQQLLRDNRDGTRVGFPFPVIDEILTLSAILEEELGPCPRSNDKVQTRR